MSLNIYKNDISNITYNTNIWLILTSILGKISNDILRGSLENMEYNIILILYFLIKIAYIFDINLDNAWIEWKNKAMRKKYQSSSSISYSSSFN